MRTFLRVLLWGAGFIAAIAALLFVFGAWVSSYWPELGRGAANTIGLGLPGLAALWILFLGFRHANSRAAVRACAISAGLLVAVQALIVTVLMLYASGFGSGASRGDPFAVLLAGIVLTGGLLIWRFVSRRPPARPDSPSRGA